MNTWLNDDKYGVIFDMDGVIIDTCELHKNSWLEISRIYNFKWDKSMNFKRDVFGTCSVDSAKILFGKQIEKHDMTKFCMEKDEIYIKLLHQNVKTIKTAGFDDFFKSLVNAKIPIVLATSATSEEAEFVLESLGIRKHFNGIVNISMVSHPKPHPEVYIKACFEIGLPAEKCVGFEDSISGITALNSAGIRSIVVGSSLSYKKLCESKLAFSSYIKDFTEITIDEVTQTMKKAI